jgi:hypothetical protein
MTPSKQQARDATNKILTCVLRSAKPKALPALPAAVLGGLGVFAIEPGLRN